MHKEFITLLYNKLLQRPPEDGAIKHWSNLLDNGSTPQDIIKSFLDSVEFLEKEEANNLLFVPPGHFYSPIVNPSTLENYFNSQIDSINIEGIDLNPIGQLQKWKKLSGFLPTTPFPLDRNDEFRYFFNNYSFGIGDASIYSAMLRLHKPKKIIEVGSGHSSACALDTIDRFLDNSTKITFIEPYPDLLHSLLSHNDPTSVAIFENGVQDIDLDLFRQLNADDFLFIDSTHVLKTGGDVCHEIFNILPILKSGVIIHFHDVFWPFEYPKSWIIDEKRSWNEIYALRAFLMHNNSYKIEFFNDYFVKHFTSEVQAGYPQMLNNSGGSLWLRKI